MYEQPVSQCQNSVSELRMMDMVVTTGATSHAKLQSNRQRQQTSTQLLTDRMPFLSSNQRCQHTELTY